MRKLLTGLLVAAAALGAAPATAATVVFSDNFNSYAPGVPWNGGGVWATGNSVDLVQSGTYSLTCAGGTGNCVDLTGSSPGMISQPIALAAGTYILRFVYTGNQLGEQFLNNGFTVSIGSLARTISGQSNTSNSFINFGKQFTTAGPATLSFAQISPSDQYRGNLIDSISISTVPEPATWGMMIAGFGLVGAGLRRRRRAAVATSAAAIA